MELRNNQQADMPPANRYAELRQVTETRNAELRETVERVRESAAQRREQAERLGRAIDSIELSDAASSATEAAALDREERVEQLRAASQDGSLFDRDRLARAAERLLSGD
ncbi:MAG: hypothetical protein AAF726_20350 [Planctomycetota bacterium]